MAGDDDFLPTLTWATGAASMPTESAPVQLETLEGDRYVDRGLIARGGMGEVRQVYDRLLDCEVAMKTLAPTLVGNADARKRFINEGTLTARLQHPGIVAVRDRGEREDGGLWYTMTEVRGVTLTERLADPTEREQRVRLREWVTLLQRVSEAVAYAHGQGVLHRDLKPDNLMIGEFGEVLVMDWGIALPTDVSRDAEGAVIGTARYMAPEQARGEVGHLGPWSDVYALGAILHQMLTGQPPVVGSGRQVIDVHAQHAVSPFSGGTADLPDELVAATREALQDDPQERTPDAGAFAAALQSWLLGAERRARAQVALDAAMALRPRIDRLRAQAAEHRTAAGAVLDGLAGHAPAEQKEAGWASEDLASEADLRAATLEGDWLAAVGAALELDPDLEDAHRALADHHAQQLLAAESQSRTDDVVRHEVLLRRHDRGGHRALLSPRGPVTVVTDPPGAQVTAYRYVEKRRRLVPELLGVLGRTPLSGVPLDRGSWLLELTHPECETVRYPVRIRRGGSWTGIAPGETEPHPIRLPRKGELGPEDVYVPAGWFQLGGDPLAPESLPARDLWVDAFVIRRFPVTVAEYMAFLNDLVEQGDEERARELAPRDVEGLAGPRALLVQDDAGRFAMGRGPDEVEPKPDMPMVLMGWYGARAYAAWLAQRTGQPWRLPHDLEWEKAARGVDGRNFPWGNRGELSWANMNGSRSGAPGRASVRSWSEDRSVYGVCGLAGNVRDLCANEYTKDGPPMTSRRLEKVSVAVDPEHVMTRGGSWSSTPNVCRLAIRYAAPPQSRFSVVGFRLVRSAD